MLKLSVCLQVNGKTVFWKCWKLSLKNFILLNSKLGGGQDDLSGLVSSFKLPHNLYICETNLRISTQIRRDMRRFCSFLVSLSFLTMYQMVIQSFVCFACLHGYIFLLFCCYCAPAVLVCTLGRYQPQASG